MSNRQKCLKIVALTVILLAFALSHAAQQTCELEVKTAPLILNLRLNTLPEQVQNVFGKNLKIKIKKSGERTFFQNFIKKPAPNSLKDVRALYLRFFDRRLYQIEVFYEPRFDLKTLENLIAALSVQMNFPASNWQIKYDRAEVNCGEISLVADNILNPRIELTNEIIRAAVETSREKAKK